MRVEISALTKMENKNEVTGTCISSQHQLSDSLTKKRASCQSLMEVIQTGKRLRCWAAIASS